MKLHEIKGVDFDGDTLVLKVDGGVFRVALAKVSPRLAAASDTARRRYQVSPAGYGLHWPDVDEDLSVDGLIRDAETSRRAAPEEALALHDKPERQ